MTKASSAGMVMGLLLGSSFVGIALYLLFFADLSHAIAKQDIKLYALLTGAYGLWRFVRVWLAWKEAQENV